MRTRTRRWRLLAVVGAVVLAPLVGWGAYAAVTWARFGDAREPAAADALMERYMPRHDIAEVHRRRVAAPASVAYAALRGMDLQRSGAVHAIFRAREILLGATPETPAPRRPFVDELLAIGWGVLEEVPGQQMVFGAVTQPWRADVVFRALPPADFAAWDSAGYVKIVVTLAVDSLGPRESAVRTETRALATDASSRAKFRRYWAIFSPGILLIRTQALALVGREAERAARPAAADSSVG